MIPAFPKPGQIKRVKSAVRVFADGREVCDLTIKSGREEYRSRVKKMLSWQNGTCGLQINEQCKARRGRLSFEEAQFDHEVPRGMGGAKRDDRIEIGGKRVSRAVCPWCNCLRGSRPVSDFIEDMVP
jgi:hypothetical protein